MNARSSADWLLAQTPVIQGWKKEREAQNDVDRLSFLDGNKAYIEFGETNKPGSGYVYRNDDGWTGAVWGKTAYREREDFQTFRDALDYVMGFDVEGN